MPTNKSLKSDIEKIIWKHYNPDQSMNGEEATAEVLSRFAEELEKVERAVVKVGNDGDPASNGRYNACKACKEILSELRRLKAEIKKS